MARLLALCAAALGGLFWGLALWACTFAARADLNRLADRKLLDTWGGALDACVWLGIVAAPVALLAMRVDLPRASAWVLGTGLVVVLLRVLTGPGPTVPLVAIASGIAVVVGRALGDRVAPLLRHPRAPLVAAAIPGGLGALLYSIWSVTRHARFGSGSWDMGCHVHNIWLFAHGKPWVSSVLGDANFWGGTNHFMPSLILVAPLAYTGWTGALCVAQALVIGATVVPLALLARRRGLGPLAIFGVCAACVFHVGMQSAMNFDVHENVPVPLLLLTAIWAYETDRRKLAIACLLVAFGSKESSILLVASTGLYLAAFQPGRRVEGGVITVVAFAGFFFVTGWLQPHFLEPGSRGMIHAARFAQFGDTLAQGAVNMLLHPGKALLVLFSPAQKTETLLVTFGSFGLLPLASPAALLLAAPNLVERFLSDKREMWGLGFHYSAVLVGLSAFGTVLALARIKALLARFEGSFDLAAGVFLVICVLAVGGFGSPGGHELASLEKDYFSTPAQVDVANRAVRMIPKDARVVAQNHFLPHLALREKIWLPEDRFVEKAEYVVIDPKASPWPMNPQDIARIGARLLADPAWRVVFSEGTTVVFSKRGEPAVTPTNELLAALGRSPGR